MQPRSMIRIAATVFAMALLSTFTLLAQTNPPWQSASDVRVGERGSLLGTVRSVDTSGSSFFLEPDNDREQQTVRITQTASTRYYGFGQGTEVLSASAGVRALRTGDRVQVTGIGRSGNTISSTEIMLLGRQVGSTPGSSSTGQSVEGIVRQIAAADNRFTIETTDRRLLTVYGTSATPVNYQGRAYRISNLEVGDRVRVQVESSTSEAVRARSVDVIADVRGADGRTLTSVYGRVTRIDTRAQTLRIDAGAREVRVDARNARDSEGRTFRLSDIRVGDSIEVSGSFDAADTFRADTIRFGDGSAVTGGGIRNPGPTVVERPVTRGYETFVIYGTVEREIGSEETLLVRDSDSDRELEVYLLDDFVVRLVNGSYVTADQLEEGTRVVIQAFRDRDGFYIAQTIRTR